MFCLGSTSGQGNLEYASGQKVLLLWGLPCVFAFFCGSEFWAASCSKNRDYFICFSFIVVCGKRADHVLVILTGTSYPDMSKTQVLLFILFLLSKFYMPITLLNSSHLI